MLSYTFQELVWATGGQLHGVVEGSFHEIATDSRRISSPRGVLFFALRGPRHDGHDFVPTLYRRGVRRFVISEVRAEYHDLPEASFLLVDDTLRALQLLAAYHRQRFSLPVVGIAGSNGKTIVKEWLSALLSRAFRVHHSPRSYNSQVGVPLSVLGLMPTDEVGVYEAGISTTGEMDRLEGIIRPTIGLFTNLGHAHQEGFPDMETKAREKFQLFRRAERLILCADQTGILELGQAWRARTGHELITWTTHGAQGADISIHLGREAGGRREFQLEFQGNTFDGWLPSTDAATIENALHALVAALSLGLDPESTLRGVEELEPIPMRLERRESMTGKPLINDSYSCDLESLGIALDFLALQAGPLPKTLILSDILQSGRPAPDLYREVRTLMQNHGVKQLIGIGPEIHSQRELFAEGQFFDTTEDFLQHFDRRTLGEQAILVKGSRPFGFERISQWLEKRMHRTVMEISLNALEHNLNHYRSKLHRGVRLLVLVKAFAYGNGRDELAQLLAYHQVDYLGVAIADEGIALRKAGIELPIVVLNPAPDAYEAILEYRLEPEIFSPSSLRGFSQAARRRGQARYPIHLKLDTGMHRVGFDAAQIDGLLHDLQSAPHLRVASIFTHLAAADEPAQDEFTTGQINLFSLLAERIASELGYRPLRHVLNTAGIERFPHAQLDMVRLGIGLHGISSTGETGLRPVATLKSFITQIKTLEAGETVGYGRRFKAQAPMRIATIPIGYADGYNRGLGNGQAQVLIHGQLCPTVGNICMDTCMVDLRDVQAVEGDPVTLFGTQPRVEDLARALNTIPYEVLSCISPRVPRIYFTD